MKLSLAERHPMQSILTHKNNRLYSLMLIFSGVVVLSLSSQVAIPFIPVPMTLQSAMVLLIGCIYGPRLGALTVVSYLSAGCLGFPVFANWTSGLSVITSVTGGYLLGFVPAVIVTGYLMENWLGGSKVKAFLAALIGDAIIFASGLLILAAVFGLHHAIEYGLMPFIISEPVKLLLVASIAPHFWRQR